MQWDHQDAATCAATKNARHRSIRSNEQWRFSAVFFRGGDPIGKMQN